DDEIKFIRISGPRTNSKPVSVVIARLDLFRAFDNIIEAGNGSLKHIRTIIIDDFDGLIDRWAKTDIVAKELNGFKITYYQKLLDKQLKDLYFIGRNNSIQINGILRETGFEHYSWLLAPIEAATL